MLVRETVVQFFTKHLQQELVHILRARIPQLHIDATTPLEGKILKLQKGHRSSWHICPYTCVLNHVIDHVSSVLGNEAKLPTFIYPCPRETLFENAFLLVNDHSNLCFRGPTANWE